LRDCLHVALHCQKFRGKYFGRPLDNQIQNYDSNLFIFEESLVSAHRSSCLTRHFKFKYFLLIIQGVHKKMVQDYSASYGKKKRSMTSYL